MTEVSNSEQEVVVVQSFSHVRHFETPRAAACQASLSITVSQSLLPVMSIAVRQGFLSSDTVENTHICVYLSLSVILLSTYLSSVIYQSCVYYLSIIYYHLPAAAAAKSLQSCLTLCDPIDGSPPGSPIPGIL